MNWLQMHPHIWTLMCCFFTRVSLKHLLVQNFYWAGETFVTCKFFHCQRFPAKSPGSKQPIEWLQLCLPYFNTILILETTSTGHPIPPVLTLVDLSPPHIHELDVCWHVACFTLNCIKESVSFLKSSKHAVGCNLPNLCLGCALGAGAIYVGYWLGP